VKLLRPLRERDFASLWTGMTVSPLGDGIYLVAIAWQVYDLENDPVALSLVGLSFTGGMVAFLLTGGIVRSCSSAPARRSSGRRSGRSCPTSWRPSTSCRPSGRRGPPHAYCLRQCLRRCAAGQ
jgi:Transmembrane secretion effector